ncbi:MAG: PAS domain S-box protein [Betaproteobacteria bacterium]
MNAISQNGMYANGHMGRRMRWWPPVLIFTVLLAATFFLLSLSSSHEASQTQEQLISDTLWVRQAIQYQLDRSAESLQLLAKEMDQRSLSMPVVRGRLEAFMRNTKEARSVAFVDAELSPVVGLGRDGSEATAPIDVSDDERTLVRAAIDNGRANRQVFYGNAYQAAWGPALNLYVTLPAPTADKPYTRMSDRPKDVRLLICVYSMNGVLNENVPWWFAQDHEVTLTDFNENVRGSRAVSGPGRNVYTHQTTLELQGVSLLLRTNSLRTAPSLVPNALRGSIAVLMALLLLSLYALWRDTKRRVHAEEMLLDEAAFRKAVGDSVVTGLRARDLSGRVTYVNPAFCKMVGYCEDDLVGKSPPMAYWAPAYRQEYEARMAQILAGTVSEHAFETVFQRADGPVFPVMIYEAPLRDAYGKQTGWMSSIVDVSEQKQAEESMRTQQERLQNVVRLTTMGEIASTLAHELNQPLAAITNYVAGSLNMLKTGGASITDIQTALEKANQQAQRAGQIIRRVHEYVRKQEPQRLEIVLAELVQDCMPLIELQARHTGVRMVTSVPEQLPRLMGDPVLLQQVLLNITRNAFEAMSSSGQARKRLEISACVEGKGMLRLAVRDYGTGIPEELREKLFSPFFTTKAEGMGMGLSICRSIMEAHRGRLWFESFDDGTAFCMLLPCLFAERSE